MSSSAYSPLDPLLENREMFRVRQWPRDPLASALLRMIFGGV
jgi:hypothetical protein